MAALDGSPVFGEAVSVSHNPHPNAQQINNFFGINGTQTLFGGTRGRTFMIKGLFVGDTPADCAAAEGDLLNFADGLTHTLEDNVGRSWPNVIFKGEYQPSPNYHALAGGGVCLPYKCVMEGLT
jgi:hypothetical protein